MLVGPCASDALRFDRWRQSVGGRALLLRSLCLLGICLASGAAAPASASAAGKRDATNSRAARRDAIQSMPLEKLDPKLREKVTSVTSRPSIYRRLPIQVIDCDPSLYLFLIRNPEVVVNIWEVMGISKVELTRTGPDTFRATDGAGTTGVVKYCYSDHDTHLVYAEGSYEGPMFSKPLRARCVLLLKSGYMQETNDRHYVTSRLDAFIHIEHVGVDLLAKTLHPLVTKSADYNFTETTAFLSSVSRTAELNSRGMLRLAGKLTRLEPDVRKQFGELTTEVAKKAADRNATAAATKGLMQAKAATVQGKER